MKSLSYIVSASLLALALSISGCGTYKTGLQYNEKKIEEMYKKYPNASKSDSIQIDEKTREEYENWLRKIKTQLSIDMNIPL